MIKVVSHHVKISSGSAVQVKEVIVTFETVLANILWALAVTEKNL